MRNLVRIGGLAVVLAVISVSAATAAQKPTDSTDKRPSLLDRVDGSASVAPGDVRDVIADWREQIRQQAASRRPAGNGTVTRQPWWSHPAGAGGGSGDGDSTDGLDSDEQKRRGGGGGNPGGGNPGGGNPGGGGGKDKDDEEDDVTPSSPI